MFERRTGKEYIKIDNEHSLDVIEERKQRGIESPFSIDENCTYDKIPDVKVFDFLRKAFEECEWCKVKKFHFKDSTVTFYVDGVYFKHFSTGYVLIMRYHNVYFNGTHDYYNSIIKNVSRLDNIEDKISPRIDDVVIDEFL